MGGDPCLLAYPSVVSLNPVEHSYANTDTILSITATTITVTPSPSKAMPTTLTWGELRKDYTSFVLWATFLSFQGGLWLWEYINTFPLDWALIRRRYPLRPSGVCFVLARIALVAHYCCQCVGEEQCNRFTDGVGIDHFQLLFHTSRTKALLHPINNRNQLPSALDLRCHVCQ